MSFKEIKTTVSWRSLHHKVNQQNTMSVSIIPFYFTFPQHMAFIVAVTLFNQETLTGWNLQILCSGYREEQDSPLSVSPQRDHNLMCDCVHFGFMKWGFRCKWKHLMVSYNINRNHAPKCKKSENKTKPPLLFLAMILPQDPETYFFKSLPKSLCRMFYSLSGR